MSFSQQYIKDRVKVVGECWIWQKALDADGYAVGYVPLEKGGESTIRNIVQGNSWKHLDRASLGIGGWDN